MTGTRLLFHVSWQLVVLLWLQPDGLQAQSTGKDRASFVATQTYLVSRSQTLSSIVQHRRGKGLGAFPGDDVSFLLGLGEVINVNRRFDLLRERFGSVCARAMVLALESAANSDRRSCQGAWVRAFKGGSAIEKFVCGQDVFVSLPTGFRKSVKVKCPISEHALIPNNTGK